MKQVNVKRKKKRVKELGNLVKDDGNRKKIKGIGDYQKEILFTHDKQDVTTESLA